MAIEVRAVASLPDPEADDVDLAGGGEDYWVAWSRASLRSETVRLARLSGSECSEPLEYGGRAFRPSLALLGDGAVLALSAAAKDTYAPAGWILGADGSQRDWSVSEAQGASYQVVVSGTPGADQVWLAWEERRGAASRIRFGRLFTDGRVEPKGAVEPKGGFARSPALVAAGDGGGWLAWIEGRPRQAGRVRAAPLGPGGALGRPVDVDPHPAPQEAPAIALDPSTGEPLLAWHTSARSTLGRDVLRWPRLARLRPDRSEVGLVCPDPEELSRDEAGEDQGWEFPALTVGADRTAWLAGRSSHGFHLACIHHDGSWTERRPLSQPGWGGRGRKLALVADGSAAVLARRELDGIVIDRLRTPHAQARDARPAPDDPIAPADMPTPRPVLAPSSRRRHETPVLFGDLHQHTAHSDGCGTPEELWLLAREHRELDFAAITDHDRFCRRAIGPATWKYLCDVADSFHEPGQFVAFSAYEFTGPRHPGPGHKCVYFGDEVPDRVPDKDVDTLFEVLRRVGGIAVPHHVGWTGTGADHHDPALQPVWEICSVHGCYECHPTRDPYPPRGDVILDGHFIKDALESGLRFGLIGSTDSHGLLWHHGITSKRDPFSTGLAAVVGAERDRSSILEAIRARRTYATTGARIELAAELSGAPLGSELPRDTRGELAVKVQGTAPLERVVLVRRGGEEPLSTEGASCRAKIPVSLGDERNWDYLYLKIVQEDGEMAFSSPFWLAT